ncbi:MULTISPECIES: hypothetical protein [unclassified Bradyrhizobium]|uniref:hypothetical protein n=1 Tax=unclassified Bradyrhizobium TaxID=2631580 RepID=UPI001FF973F7|nr:MULTISPECIES: hypothetical protein [unclassified Bradyrhizobium]MCK1420544.1 hypothetical protein [Bradyrhizobium sp. CW12]MCK1646772.1 hypothetical protein [Bradyrhizobium sp. 154]
MDEAALFDQKRRRMMAAIATPRCALDDKQAREVDVQMFTLIIATGENGAGV